MKAKLYEQIAIVATVDPVDANNTDTDSDEIDMNKYEELLFIIMCGVLAASSTTDITIKDSVTAGGSLTAITGKTQAIINTDDAKQFLISLSADELNAGARYVKLTQNNSAHSQILAIIVLGIPRDQPATDHDLSSVQTVVD